MMSEQREKEIEEYAKSSPAITAKGAEMIYDLLSEVRTLRADDTKLRRLLGIRHNNSHRIYVEDGEVQCAECGIDFMRDNPDAIEQVFINGGIAALAKETP